MIVVVDTKREEKQQEWVQGDQDSFSSSTEEMEDSLNQDENCGGGQK